MFEGVITPYICTVCEWIYDDESAPTAHGVPTPFDEIDESWVCPNCGVNQSLFEKAEDDRDLPKQEEL
jgi:rubredoxin